MVGVLGSESWLRGFDAQLGHLYDACTSLPQKSQAAIKWREIRKKKISKQDSLKLKVEITPLPPFKISRYATARRIS